MSKIKNISRTGWLVAGIIAALVLVPTTAVAVTTATETIIKGGTAGGEANVTAAHQLLTTAANPKDYYNNSPSFLEGQSGEPGNVASPPSGEALVVTTIHIDTYNDPTPGTVDDLSFAIENGTACSGGAVVGTYSETVNPGSVGETDIPFNPGLGVPAGDALCGGAGDNVDAADSVTGYTVPSNAVPAGSLHRAPAALRPKS